MTRVALLLMLTIPLLATLRAAWAQPVGKVIRVAYLTAASTSADAPVTDSFRHGMQELGYLGRRGYATGGRGAEQGRQNVLWTSFYDVMTRRQLLIALGAGALAIPLSSRAQQKGKVWRVGFLAQRKVAAGRRDQAPRRG